jgi:hypothetical protein
MANSVASRVVFTQGFDGKGYSDENSLVNSMLTKPDEINPVITHLMGREEDKFPLTFLTEGQKNGRRIIELNNTEYTWRVMGRLRKADTVHSSTYTSSDKPGLNNQPFFVVMKSNWIKRQHLVVSPNGTQARVSAKPEPVGGGFYKYVLVLTNPSPTAYCDSSQLLTGTKWSMTGGAPVSTSASWGNESNVTTPGMMKNQVSTLRKSYRLNGNITNKFVEFQLVGLDGKYTKKWIDFERYQHMLDWKQSCEEHYWESVYNRRTDGVIPLIDEDTGLPIPIGAGVFDQIDNEDSYAPGFLTTSKVKQMIGDALYGATDKKNMTVVMYGGQDFLEYFDTAMKNGVPGFTAIDKGTFIKGENRSLVLGGFFNTYEHIDGHTVITKHLPLLDDGGRAESSELNPLSGRPLTSSEAYVIDQSIYDGDNNILMVSERGRSMVTGVVQGMAATPFNFLGNAVNSIATEQDSSSVHFLSSKGVCIRRNTHCLKLKPILA